MKGVPKVVGNLQPDPSTLRSQSAAVTTATFEPRYRKCRTFPMENEVQALAPKTVPLRLTRRAPSSRFRRPKWRG